MAEIVILQQSLDERRMNEIRATADDKKRAAYYKEYERFCKWCETIHYPLTFSSLEKYLLHQIEVKQVRLSTFNRKVAAVSFFLRDYHQFEQTTYEKEGISALRKMYESDEYLRLKAMKPSTNALPKSDVLFKIREYNSANKEERRIYAIGLINLITANRPSEMVRIKISDFDYEARELLVLQVKQGDTIRKRLTDECVSAVRKYVEDFKLTPDDYFVGCVNRHGQYRSQQILENSYRLNIKKWFGFAPYTFRKTQITNMYKQNADLPTIARQSGHKSLQTIATHYVQVDTSDLDKYI